MRVTSLVEGALSWINGSSLTHLNTSVCGGCRDDIDLNGTGDLVGGRPCVALRTPDRLCNCLGPVQPETRAKGRYRTTDRGKTKSSQALVFLAPASSSPSCDQANIQLVCGAVVAQPVENRLARPIRSPPSRRRACVARWSQVIHRYPPLLESWRGNLLTATGPVQSP
jgi:hypothetical protein